MNMVLTSSALKFAPLRLLLAALSFGFCMHANAALTLQMRVTSHVEAVDGASTPPPDKTQEEQVFIGAHYVAIKSEHTLSLLDFAKRRRYQVDLQAARYVDYSLHDTVGFRVMEMQNRQGLARALAAMHSNLPPYDVVYIEQALSVLASADRKLAETREGSDVVDAIDGKPLLRRSAESTPVSASDAAGFVNFLRYTAGGHPLVLDKLAAAREIPRQLTFSYREAGGRQTRRYEILSVATAAPASYDLAPYRQGTTSTDDVDRLLDKIAMSAPPAPGALRTAMQQQATRAFAEKRPFDAMLGAMEFQLMTGEQLGPFTPEQLVQVRADPSAQRYAAVINANDKAALTAAIPVLQQLQTQSTERRHLLALNEANDHQGLGELAIARPMFVRVLSVNPWLAGAYKDLGDLQFRQFDMARAWRCWDAGRRIAPNLSIFSGINQLENTLLQQHPEFF
jgi:tetratricopeptide (TPR) repeat protein